MCSTMRAMPDDEHAEEDERRPRDGHRGGQTCHRDGSSALQCSDHDRARVRVNCLRKEINDFTMVFNVPGRPLWRYLYVPVHTYHDIRQNNDIHGNLREIE